MHMYIHANIFFNRNSSTMYVRLMSESQFENGEQRPCQTLKPCFLKAVGEKKKDGWISVEAADSLWELLIASVSCLLFTFFNHISPPPSILTHTGEDA